MRSPVAVLALLLAPGLNSVMGSVFLPYNMQTQGNGAMTRAHYHKDFSYGPRKRSTAMGASSKQAMAIPGYGIAEQVVVGGFANFLQLYNLLITGRILLSWIPQAQGFGPLQPLYGITDPYLNLFRNLIPAIGGIDLSPILAFVALNAAQSATAAIGCELSSGLQNKLVYSKFGQAAARGSMIMKEKEKRQRAATKHLIF